MIPVHDIAHPIRSAMWSWYEAKLVLERSIAFSSDSLHVLAGVFVQLGAGLLLGRPITSWRPWFTVLMLVSLNEWSDLIFDHWPARALQYGESAKDLILTMLLPSTLLVAARYAPSLFKLKWGSGGK